MPAGIFCVTLYRLSSNPSEQFDTTGDTSDKKPRGNKKGRRKVSDEESLLEFISVD
jgi:hypothetical protein